MNSRKVNFPKKKPTKRAKLLFGTLFLSIGISSSITIAFADQDIQGLLSNWFAKQQTKSVETIEKAILSEKELQMQRLKEELQIEMNDAEQQLFQFTEKEKQQRIKNLKHYTDKLIKGLKIDNTEEEEAIKNELETIFNEAIQRMDSIGKSQQPEETSENENSTENPEQETIVEIGEQEPEPEIEGDNNAGN
jgi:hypothetical protein